MTIKSLSRDEAENLMRFVASNPEPPLKIVEQKLRIEEATRQAEQDARESGMVDSEAIDKIIKMKIGLEVLYSNWAQGIARIRWRDIPSRSDITVEQILLECVYSTESMTGEMGVEALAEFLDTHGLEGILKKLAERYLAEIRPLLEEVLPFDDETSSIFQDPKEFFGVSDAQEVRDRIVQRFHSSVNRHSPQYVIRAMIAHINFALGEYSESLSQAGFARSEKDVENFGVKFSRVKDPEVDASMLSVERRKAEILIELLSHVRQT